MADGRDVPDATFGRPDLTTFTLLDERYRNAIICGIDSRSAVLRAGVATSTRGCGPVGRLAPATLRAPD
jgi:hypothetical protein